MEKYAVLLLVGIVAVLGLMMIAHVDSGTGAVVGNARVGPTPQLPQIPIKTPIIVNKIEQDDEPDVVYVEESSEGLPSAWDCEVFGEIKKVRTELGLSTSSFLLISNLCGQSSAQSNQAVNPSEWDCTAMYEVMKVRTESGLSTDSFLLVKNICSGLYPYI